jgi:hypothetical protein
VESRKGTLLHAQLNWRDGFRRASVGSSGSQDLRIFSGKSRDVHCCMLSRIRGLCCGAPAWESRSENLPRQQDGRNGVQDKFTMLLQELFEVVLGPTIVRLIGKVQVLAEGLDHFRCDSVCDILRGNAIRHWVLL